MLMLSRPSCVVARWSETGKPVSEFHGKQECETQQLLKFIVVKLPPHLLVFQTAVRDRQKVRKRLVFLGVCLTYFEVFFLKGLQYPEESSQVLEAGRWTWSPISFFR